MAWYHLELEANHGSAFHIPSLGVQLRPGHGSILLLQTNKLVHGTAPLPEHVKGTLIGSAMLCREHVLKEFKDCSLRAVVAVKEAKEMIDRKELTKKDLKAIRI